MLLGTYLDRRWELEFGADELPQYGEGCTGLTAEVPYQRGGCRSDGGTPMLRAALVRPRNWKAINMILTNANAENDKHWRLISTANEYRQVLRVLW